MSYPTQKALKIAGVIGIIFFLIPFATNIAQEGFFYAFTNGIVGGLLFGGITFLIARSVIKIQTEPAIYNKKMEEKLERYKVARANRYTIFFLSISALLFASWELLPLIFLKDAPALRDRQTGKFLGALAFFFLGSFAVYLLIRGKLKDLKDADRRSRDKISKARFWAIITTAIYFFFYISSTITKINAVMDR